jgi:hypothetical protein
VEEALANVLGIRDAGNDGDKGAPGAAHIEQRAAFLEADAADGAVELHHAAVVPGLHERRRAEMRLARPLSRAEDANGDGAVVGLALEHADAAHMRRERARIRHAVDFDLRAGPQRWVVVGLHEEVDAARIILKKGAFRSRVVIGDDAAQLHRRRCPRTKAFTLTEAGVEKSPDGKVRVSKIFKWYDKDFEKEGGALNYIGKTRGERIAPDAKVEYKAYDWSLNDRK